MKKLLLTTALVAMTTSSAHAVISSGIAEDRSSAPVFSAENDLRVGGDAAVDGDTELNGDTDIGDNMMIL